MRFTILTQYFPPEIGAAQARLLAVSKELQRAGHEVTVVTALPNHPTGRLLPGYRSRLLMRESVEGVPVIRTWVYPALGSGLRRILNYLSFAVSCVPGLLRAPKADYLVVESPPLLSAVPALLFRRTPVILNVADLWPDSIEQLGTGFPRWALRALAVLERWAYRRARFVTAVTEGIRTTLIEEKGLAPDKVLFLPNGVDLDVFRPGAPSDEAVFVYAGTHGYAHGLDTILEAAALLHDEPMRFVFVGDGSDKARLQAEAANLPNVAFLDAAPAAQVAELLRSATAGLACLRDIPVLRGARSVKVFSIMASGRPVLYSGAGEDRSIIAAADAGIVVGAGDAKALAEGARQLAADRALADRLGANARRYAEAHLSWESLVRDWLGVLERRRLSSAYAGYAGARRWSGANAGNAAIERERNQAVFSRLDLSGRILEVGCAAGGVLRRLEEAGASSENLVGVDVRLDRLAQGTGNLVGADGAALPFPDDSFDAVLLFTVVSSIADDAVVRGMAREVDRVLRPGGTVAWYDMRRRNPRNRNVRPVLVESVFPDYEFEQRMVTVLPPLARRLGRFYPLLTRLRFLHTHVAAVGVRGRR
jgi:colanic acid biosynthesis glycosyl transferase WcaI